ncbi:hypothetical protein [Flavobacterium sp. '19STA2R22 D10 B1']|uniref:hypothetical protein n=1 Tax=Flavobacterium aerium TaxID=3037261 RepID=UPI00278BCA22|nr:hypothetical protein [Flavobacterium sp. '19STA2R22 D10 B1']
MFILFKKRGFSEFVSDTFSFFKQNGKHFFKNYLIMNGIPLLVITVLIYFIFKVYFEILFGGSINAEPDFNIFSGYFNNNMGLIIGTLIVFVVMLFTLTLLNFAYPAVYLELYEQNKGNNFTIRDIAKQIKLKAGRIISFSIGGFFILFPLTILVFGLLILSIFIIIGIPLIIIGVPAYVSWITLSFYEHINNDKGFFSALRKGFQLVKEQFWPTVGSTIICYLIIQAIVTIVALVPYVIGMISLFTSTTSGKSAVDPEQTGFFATMMIIAMVVSTLANYIMNNLLITNQGIIYYSIREINENNTPQSDIELIGTSHSE